MLWELWIPVSLTFPNPSVTHCLFSSFCQNDSSSLTPHNFENTLYLPWFPSANISLQVRVYWSVAQYYDDRVLWRTLLNPQWSLVEGTQSSVSLIDNIPCISSKSLLWEIIYKEMSFFLQQLESICGFVRPHGVWNTSLSYILWSISKSLCHYTPHPPFLNPALQISI